MGVLRRFVVKNVGKVVVMSPFTLHFKDLFSVVSKILYFAFILDTNVGDRQFLETKQYGAGIPGHND